MLKSDAIHVRTIRPCISVHFKIVDPYDNIILENTHYKATDTNERKVYELKDWDLFQCEEREVCSKYDGHSPKDAMDRMKKMLSDSK